MTKVNNKILLTTVHQPLGVESETCSKNIQAEMYHAQVTRAQGIFSIRTICTGWGLEFIAANLKCPVTVLHYPTKRVFLKELRRGYNYVGIGFVICTFPKVIELCKWIRRENSEIKIVLGGYGTVLKECDQYADFVCRGEGVNFFKRLLGEKELDTFVMLPALRKMKILSITTRPEAMIYTGLGCSRGCDFCCTSHFFDKKYYPLLKSGKEIHDVMSSIDFKKSQFRNIGVIDEDFLADRNRIEPMIHLNRKEIEKPILFSCLTSLKSLSQYSIDELLFMGLSGVWVGIESKRAKYDKLKNVNAVQIIHSLKQVGIIPLTSMIVGYDWHDENTIEEDFQYILSLKPALSQFMMYSPCPQTPLYNRLIKQNRMIEVPYKFRDGFHALFKHPNFSSERLEELLWSFFRREYEELGPSVCRILEIQLTGYQTLHNKPDPLFQSRAREYRKVCFDIFPILKTAIHEAPSHKVKEYLCNLRLRIEEEFKIPRQKKMIQYFVPTLALYTKLMNQLFPNPQPKSEIKRYHFI